MIALLGKVILYFLVFQFFLFLIRFFIGLGSAYKITKQNGKSFEEQMKKAREAYTKPGQSQKSKSAQSSETIIEAEYKVLD